MKNLKKNFNLEIELAKKHRRGQKKYGAFSFLNDGRNMKLEAADELVDAINYLVYEKIKEDYGEKLIKTWTIKEFNKEYRDYIYGISAAQKGFIGSLVKLIDKLNV